MIAVFAALRLEVQRFLRRVDVRERARLGSFPVTLGDYEGRPLLVCHTGIGSRAAEAATAVVGRYRPEFVFSVGLAGALSPECAVPLTTPLENLKTLVTVAEGMSGKTSGWHDTERNAL